MRLHLDANVVAHLSAISKVVSIFGCTKSLTNMRRKAASAVARKISNRTYPLLLYCNWRSMIITELYSEFESLWFSSRVKSTIEPEPAIWPAWLDRLCYSLYSLFHIYLFRKQTNKENRDKLKKRKIASFGELKFSGTKPKTEPWTAPDMLLVCLQFFYFSLQG